MYLERCSGLQDVMKCQEMLHVVTLSILKTYKIRENEMFASTISLEMLRQTVKKNFYDAGDIEAFVRCNICKTSFVKEC